MPTPGERRALLFLGTVALLGAGVRVVGAVRGGEAGAPAQPLLERQRLAAEREGARAREERARRAEREARRKAGGGGGRRPRRGTADSGAASPIPVAPVDVDQADTIALAALPGVGPALARRIVADRAEHGAFGGIEALDAVPGVGPRLLERLSRHVTFSGPRRPPLGDESGPRGAEDRRRGESRASPRRARP